MARSKQTAGLSWTLEPARVEQELLATATSAGDLRRPRTAWLKSLMEIEPPEVEGLRGVL